MSSDSLPWSLHYPKESRWLSLLFLSHRANGNADIMNCNTKRGVVYIPACEHGQKLGPWKHK